MSAFGLLSQEVREIASDLGLRQETLIQSEAIPPILRGENVLLISPTGSGKTEADTAGSSSYENGDRRQRTEKWDKASLHNTA